MKYTHNFNRTLSDESVFEAIVDEQSEKRKIILIVDYVERIKIC